MKITVKTRISYDSNKKATFSFNFLEKDLIKEALVLLDEECYNVYDRGKDFIDDAEYLAKSKCIKQILKKYKKKKK
jgi:hypothetical protein